MLLILLIWSCKKEQIQEPTIYKTYYPKNIGKSLYYNVTEINIDAVVNIFDTLEYELKEFFESEYTDAEGNNNIRIERYYKNKGDSIWRVMSIWYVSIRNNSVEKTEDNYRYKRLSLPLVLDKTWDGNILNTISEKIYTVTNIDEQENINGTHFNNICTVLQDDSENLIEKYYSIEKYAENIGLVYRENINISQMEPLPGVPYKERIKVGTLYTQTFLRIE